MKCKLEKPPMVGKFRIYLGNPGSLTKNGKKGAVYLTQRPPGGKVQKISFHSSGICRWAFTEEHGTPAAMADRVMKRWKRKETPPGAHYKELVLHKSLSRQIFCLVSIKTRKKIAWIDAAQKGKATIVEFFYTHEDEQMVKETFEKYGERNLIAYFQLPREEAFANAYRHSEWSDKELRMHGNGNISDLLFSPHDPLDTGRPIRILLTCPPLPHDGDALFLRELGGYPLR